MFYITNNKYLRFECLLILCESLQVSIKIYYYPQLKILEI